MNRIPEETYVKADEMFTRGASQREVCRKLGIAKETAARIQKRAKQADIAFLGKTRVNTGKRKDGTVSHYFTSEPREHWNQQHYGRFEDFL